MPLEVDKLKYIDLAIIGTVHGEEINNNACLALGSYPDLGVNSDHLYIMKCWKIIVYHISLRLADNHSSHNQLFNRNVGSHLNKIPYQNGFILT